MKNWRDWGFSQMIDEFLYGEEKKSSVEKKVEFKEKKIETVGKISESHKNHQFSDYLQFTKKTGFKIGVVISLMCICLFVFLYVIVVDQSQQKFISVVRKIEPPSYYFQNQPFDYNPSTGKDLLQFDLNGIARPKPLQQVFSELLQSSLLWVSLLAICISFLIGYLSSKVFSQPLEKLIVAMRNLRKNKYQSQLMLTGTQEIDGVIDEFNRLSKELQKVENLRKDLISDTSHELKTPLTSLMGQLEAVRDGVLPLDPKRINSLLGQVDRLNEMIDRLQEFSRLRSKNQQIEKEPVRLREMIESVTSLEEKRLKKAGIEVHNDVESDFELQAKPEMLEQVFINLFDNAIAYSKATGITISAEEKEIVMSDNGIGVPDEHLPYIFERFYRVEKSRNRATGGLGLGLAIVQEIIEAHGWKIEARNEEGLKLIISFS